MHQLEATMPERGAWIPRALFHFGTMRYTKRACILYRENLFYNGIQGNDRCVAMEQAAANPNNYAIGHGLVGIFSITFIFLKQNERFDMCSCEKNSAPNSLVLRFRCPFWSVLCDPH